MRDFINLMEGAYMSEQWSAPEVSSIIKDAKSLGFSGFGGACGEAAIAINDMIFDGNGSLVAAVNKAFFDHGRLIGHVVVLYDGVLWDADGVPKQTSDIEHWGMLDVDDTDYRATAEECGIEWSEDSANTVEMIEFENDEEVLNYFNEGRLAGMFDILEQAITCNRDQRCAFRRQRDAQVINNRMQMREILNIVETIQRTISPSELIEWVRSSHHNEQDLDEGDLENRIWKFRSFELTNLPVASLYAPWLVDDGMAREYAERLRRGEQPPPIIYDMDAGVVIDGTHRIEAAKIAGVETIPAYVGTSKNIDPSWSETDEG